MQHAAYTMQHTSLSTSLRYSARPVAYHGISLAPRAWSVQPVQRDADQVLAGSLLRDVLVPCYAVEYPTTP